MNEWANEVEDCFKMTHQGIEIIVEKANIVSCDDDVVAVPVDRYCTFSNGVSKVVASAAGPLFMPEVNKVVKHRRYRPGDVEVFGGHDLKAAHVIAAVSSSDFMDIQLVYENVFRCASNEGASSLCVSGIGTGIRGVRSGVAAQAACKALQNFAVSSSPNSPLKKVHFVDLKDSVICSFTIELGRLTGTGTGVDLAPNNQAAEIQQPEISNYDEATSSDDYSAFFHTVGEPSDKCCSICLTGFSEQDGNNAVIELSKCRHMFHKECITRAFRCLQAQCPVCKQWYGVPRGNQPLGGRMKVTVRPGKLPGYPGSKNYIEICYSIPGGVQTAEHLRPGVPFSGTTRYAYLPNTSEGLLVLDLLRLAFNYRLTFTVGDSVTTGAKNVVVWNNIHHKTTVHGGIFGYPDDGYLSRVREELAAVGIDEQLLKITRESK